MSRCSLMAVAIVLSAAIAGCASATHEVGSVTVSKCGSDSHTVAYPNDPNPKNAYACRSDDAGFFGAGGADSHEGMNPK
jgi:hypothetical protein